eukprot:12911701-Prorocentrum_lima.AAC.1
MAEVVPPLVEMTSGWAVSLALPYVHPEDRCSASSGVLKDCGVRAGAGVMYSRKCQSVFNGVNGL